MRKNLYILFFTMLCLFALPAQVVANTSPVVEDVIGEEKFSFSLALKGNDVEVIWKNSPENAKSYIIERSFDGNRYSRVFRSSFTDEKSFADDVSYINADEAYYRFVFTFENGEEFVSDSKSVSLSSQKHLQPEVFVNGGQVEFEFYSSSNGYTSVQIFNGVGNIISEDEIRTSKGDNSHAITLYGMRSGMYFLRLEQDGKFTTTKFFVR